jgi:hypothetical protein
MANRENRKASGAIELYYDWWESGSSHREQTKSADLSVREDGSIILKVDHRDDNFIKGSSDKSEASGIWSIEIGKLVKLIKDNGRKIGR